MPCAPPPRDALAALTCAEPTLALADISMVQTYYALRASVGVAGEKPLKSQFLSFVIQTRAACGLPPVEPNRDQSSFQLPATAASCVAGAYDKQRAIWQGGLSGPAAEEAVRDPEENVVLQGKLRDLGFLPKDATIDGVFGTGTRSAILAWQGSRHLSATGFLSNSDAALLNGGDADPLELDYFPSWHGQALAGTKFDGQPFTLTVGGLRVTASEDIADDPKFCADNGMPFQVAVAFADHQRTCDTFRVSVAVGGKTEFEAPFAALAGPSSSGPLELHVSVRRLDPAAREPQVIVTGYTGGAHCCTDTVVLTEDKPDAWTPVKASEVDGDVGYRCVDLKNDGTDVLADYDEAFDYRFASHAGSYEPTKVLRLVGTKLIDITKAPATRDFLVDRLRSMEETRARFPDDEPMGYLAAWVAQEALLGRFAEAWQTMLTAYKPTSVGADGDRIYQCRIDRKAWPKDAAGNSTLCPDDQTYTEPFPEALALFLYDRRYIDEKTGVSIGYDAPQIEAAEAAGVRAATEAYQKSAQEAWYVLANSGNCEQAQMSPAAKVKADGEGGWEDMVEVRKTDASGKPIAVRVATPEPGDLVMAVDFFRGEQACQASKSAHAEQLKDLQ